MSLGVHHYSPPEWAALRESRCFMERGVIVDPPAMVRPAEDLGDLAAVANAGYHASEDAAQQCIEHYSAPGEALLKSMKLCGRGRCLTWLAAIQRFAERLTPSPSG